MRILVDMNVSIRVAEALRDQGHDVAHLREQSLSRLSDPEVFAKAWEESRVILTGDLGFGEIVAASAGHLVSVVFLRLNTMAASHVIERLDATLARFEQALEDGAIVTVEEARVRVRPLPIGD